jgi:hypothetical protein
LKFSTDKDDPAAHFSMFAKVLWDRNLVDCMDVQLSM